MAGNRRKFCRCGRGTDGEYRSESLWSRHGGEDHTATAAKCGKRCRCDKMGRSEGGADIRISSRALLGAVRRVYSFGRSGKMEWFRDSFGRSGVGTYVRTSSRALLWAVWRVYSFGRSREMVWFRDSFGRSGKMVWFREPFVRKVCGKFGKVPHLLKVSGKRGETAHLRKVGKVRWEVERCCMWFSRRYCVYAPS